MQKAAGIIEKRKTAIIEIWVETVREELTAPNVNSEPVLRDHLPLVLEDIIKIMKQYCDYKVDAENISFDNILDHSVGHGRHRSSSFGYDMEQVLKEYIFLHKIITRELRSAGVYSTEVGDLLKYVVENSMLYAGVAFNTSLQEIRQKMIGTLAHDIRNPLSTAYLTMDMLEKEKDPERLQNIKKISKNSIKRAIHLTEHLLEMISVEAGEGIAFHFSESDLMPYITSVYGEASEIYSNEIIMDCNAVEIKGIFDSAMIRRVLENIINNAVKYGKRGTPVTIRAEDHPEKVIISVHNEGEAIPENDQEKIFGFMNSTKGEDPRKLKSWGMGLTLMKAVAEAHGGSPALESTEEEGTTFTLELKKYENSPGKVKTALNIDYLNLKST